MLLFLQGDFLFLHFHLIHNLTIKHIDDSIGIIGIMQRVGYHYDSGALLVQFRKQFHHLLAILGIQISSRLIGKNQLRMRKDGTGDGGALLLTARKLRWEMLGTMGYRHALHHILCTLTALLARYSHIQKWQLDVYSL